MACFLIFFYFEFVHDRKMGLIIFTPVLAILVGILSFLLLDKLNGRGLESIDRVTFLLMFIEETKDWDAVTWLIGSPVLTPLSSHSCNTLRYFEHLFSFSGNGECFSVLLHSFILRSIFDHGVLGLLALSVTTIYIIKAKGYPHKDAISILLILFATSLSVSSFNSIYVALGLLILVTKKTNSSIIYR